MKISIDAFTRMIDSGSTPEVSYNLGVVAQQGGHLADAVIHYSRAIIQQQDFVDAYKKRALCYGRLSRNDEALKDHATVFEISKDISSAIACSNILRLKENLQESIIWANKAAKQDRNNFEVYLVRGLSYFDGGDFVNAFKDFSVCLTLSPENIQVYIQAGNTLGQMELHSEAIVYFTKGLEKAKNHYEQGMLLFNRAISKSQVENEDYKSDFKLAADLNFEPAKLALNQINNS